MSAGCVVIFVWLALCRAMYVYVSFLSMPSALGELLLSCAPANVCRQLAPFGHCTNVCCLAPSCQQRVYISIGLCVAFCVWSHQGHSFVTAPLSKTLIARLLMGCLCAVLGVVWECCYHSNHRPRNGLNSQQGQSKGAAARIGDCMTGAASRQRYCTVTGTTATVSSGHLQELPHGYTQFQT